MVGGNGVGRGGVGRLVLRGGTGVRVDGSACGPTAAPAPEELRTRLCLFVLEPDKRGERERWRVTGAACAELVTANNSVVSMHAREKPFEAMLRLRSIKRM